MPCSIWRDIKAFACYRSCLTAISATGGSHHGSVWCPTWSSSLQRACPWLFHAQPPPIMTLETTKHTDMRWAEQKDTLTSKASLHHLLPRVWSVLSNSYNFAQQASSGCSQNIICSFHKVTLDRRLWKIAIAKSCWNVCRQDFQWLWGDGIPWQLLECFFGGNK